MFDAFSLYRHQNVFENMWEDSLEDEIIENCTFGSYHFYHISVKSSLGLREIIACRRCPLSYFIPVVPHFVVFLQKSKTVLQVCIFGLLWFERMSMCLGKSVGAYWG